MTAAAHVRVLNGQARARFEALVQHTGGEQVMAIELARLMTRADYALVLG